MLIAEVLTAPRSPWRNPFVERVIGTIRRELLDHVIVLNEGHLRRRLHSYLRYYHRSRTHLALEKDAPEPRAVELPEQGTRRCPPPGRRTPPPLLPPRSVVAGDELSIRRRGDQSVLGARATVAASRAIRHAVIFKSVAGATCWSYLAAMIGAADRDRFVASTGWIEFWPTTG